MDFRNQPGQLAVVDDSRAIVKIAGHSDRNAYYHSQFFAP